MATRRTTNAILESVGEVVSDSAVVGIRWIPTFIFHALLSLVLTFPLVTRLGSAMAISPSDEGAGLYRNFFVLRWQADRFAHFYSNYWTAPVHFPATDTFALFDTQPVTGLLFAVFELISRNPVLSYNLLVLLFLTLNGVAFNSLARALEVSSSAAVPLGVLGQASPIALAHLADPTLLAVFPLVFGVAALCRFSVTGELRWAFAVAGCVILGYGTSSALLVGMSITLLILAVTLSVGPRWAATLGSLIPVVVGTLTVIAYPLWRQLSSLSNAAPIDRISTVPIGAWLEGPKGSLLSTTGVIAPRVDAFVVTPGIALFLLGVVGIVLGFGSHRRWVLGATVCGLVAFVLTLGGGDGAGGSAGAIGTIHPGLDFLRHREALATVSHAMWMGLAAVTFANLELSRFNGRRRIAYLLLALGVLEGVAMPTPMARPPELLARPWMIALEGREPSAVAHVGPRGLGPSWQDVHDTLLHGRPVVGGATSFAPLDTQVLVQRLQGFPSADGLRHLRAKGVGTLVVSKQWLNPERAAVLAGVRGAEVAFDDAQLRVYRLNPATVDERRVDVEEAPAPSPAVEPVEERPTKPKRRRRRRRGKPRSP